MNNNTQFVREGHSKLTQMAKPDKPSLFPPSLSIGAVIIFLTLANLITLKALFNATFMEAPEIAWMLSLVCAVLLDVPMSVAGLCVSQCAKGMRSKTSTILVTAGCIAAFLITLFLCMNLRMQTLKIAFTEICAAQGGLVDLAGTGCGENPDASAVVLSTARLLSFLPVATSIAAFAISFAFSNPKPDRIRKP